MLINIQKLGLNDQGRRVFSFADTHTKVYWVAPSYIHLSTLRNRILITLSFGPGAENMITQHHIFTTVDACLEELRTQCGFMSRLGELHDIYVKRKWRDDPGFHYVKGRPTIDGIQRKSFYIPKYLQYKFKPLRVKDTPEGLKALKEYHAQILHYFNTEHRLSVDDAMRVTTTNPLEKSHDSDLPYPLEQQRIIHQG